MSATVSDGAEMIAGMAPVRVLGRWVFRTVSDAELTALTNVKAMFREGEGVSVLVPAKAGEDAMAQITLQVFSALDGVGLTAAVSTTLSDAGIPCNVIAATLHDHIFVPEAMAGRAVALLQERAKREAA